MAGMEEQERLAICMQSALPASRCGPGHVVGLCQIRDNAIGNEAGLRMLCACGVALAVDEYAVVWQNLEVAGVANELLCNGTSLVPAKIDNRCEHGRSAQEAIRMGCKSPRSAIKE
eukprot:1148706-Pelagomonas_calceolata.AAC.1